MKVTVYKNGTPFLAEDIYAENLVEKFPSVYSFENPEKEEVIETEETEEDEMKSLHEAYKAKFGKNAPKNTKKQTLIDKLNDE